MRATRVQMCAEEWQLTIKDAVLATDNAPNKVVAVQLGKYRHVRCYAHMLNLAFQRALDLTTV